MEHALTSYRRSRNLTLQAFGDIVGATKAQVLKWERGALPRPETAQKIVAATEGAITLEALYAAANKDAA
jgi:transcriptional regulator with XRE-family HTH domain